MQIGNNYVQGYLLQNCLGDGIYLGKHNTPHFHMPINLDSKGFYILGKYDRVTKKYNLLAFKIPLGYAIYTPPWIYHCDAF